MATLGINFRFQCKWGLFPHRKSLCPTASFPMSFVPGVRPVCVLSCAYHVRVGVLAAVPALSMQGPKCSHFIHVLWLWCMQYALLCLCICACVYPSARSMGPSRALSSLPTLVLGPWLSRRDDAAQPLINVCLSEKKKQKKTTLQSMGY